LAALVCLQCVLPSALAETPIVEHKLDGEVVLALPREREMPNGTLLAEKGKETLVAVSPNTAFSGEVAAGELVKCFRFACGANVEVKVGLPGTPLKRPTILLATMDDLDALGTLGVRIDKKTVPAEGYLIAPLAEAHGLLLIACSPRGVLDAACSVLEETVGAAWDPPRMYYHTTPGTYALETTVRSTPKAIWTEGQLADSPAIGDRGIYTVRGYLCGAVVDWCARNRINFLMVASSRFLPLSEEEAAPVKTAFARARRLGMKVGFLNMTHRLPKAAKPLPASAPEAIALSTKLFADQYDRFNMDAMAWHTASEGIKLNMDEAYKKRPRFEWEADYFSSYYRAIRAKHPQAILGMLMGWAYMNPAEKIAKAVPKDTVSWVVPNTPIIDVSRTDLDAYGEHFSRMWYWLYSAVSADGIYPMVKCDYLEKYCREAVKRNHCLMPQTAFRSNTANMMYLARAGWRGPVENEKFVREYGTRYYGGDPAMGEFLVEYQTALKRHRLWYTNIHSRRRGPTLLPSEIATLRRTIKLAIATGKSTSSGLLRDRMKVLAVTAIHCLVVRKPDPAAVEGAAGKMPTNEELLLWLRRPRPHSRTITSARSTTGSGRSC